jgi:hypothetical protein
MTIDWKTLQPTGKCFDDALEFLWNAAHEHVNDLGTDFENYHFNFPYRLMHGICRMPVHNTPYAHAWVENIKTSHGFHAVLVNANRVFLKLPITELYEFLTPLYIVSYTAREAFEMNKRVGTYGPWRHDILQHCRNYSPGNADELRLQRSGIHRTASQGES